MYNRAEEIGSVTTKTKKMYTKNDSLKKESNEKSQETYQKYKSGKVDKEGQN